MLNSKLLKSFYPSEEPISQVKNIDLKELSHEIDFKNVDKNLQNLA
jgi:hypothetical protein